MSSPKYMDIVEWTLEQIETGVFKPGNKFLSETTLGEKFGYSRQTVRRALEVLGQGQHITRIQGSGTYISGQPGAKSGILPDGSPTMTVGIISNDLDDYIFPGVIRGIESVFTASRLSVKLASSKNTVAGENQALQIMLESQLDGLIVKPTKSALPCFNLDLYNTIIQRGIPIVFIDSFYLELPVPYVAMDDEKAGYIATQHLLGMGHHNIAGIFTHTARQGHLRYLGYMKALAEHGLPIHDDHVFWYSKENMRQIVLGSQLWDGLSSCTAALCFNDQLALMLIDLFRHAGKRVPEDFSVVGIDNSELARISSLTSVAHPGDKLGEAAADLLKSMMNGAEGNNILFPPQLVSRNSVQKLEI